MLHFQFVTVGLTVCLSALYELKQVNYFCLQISCYISWPLSFSCLCVYVRVCAWGRNSGCLSAILITSVTWLGYGWVFSLSRCFVSLVCAIGHGWHQRSGQTDRPAEEMWAHQREWGQSAMCQSQVNNNNKQINNLSLWPVLIQRICPKSWGDSGTGGK